MKTPLYSIEVWPHGWTLSGDRGGIPMQALPDSMPLFPKDAVMDPGIARHLSLTASPRITLALGLPWELATWREEITDSLADQPAQTRWWHGVDVGLSSAAIFGVFATLHRETAANYGRGSVPWDAADFGRCQRLLALFPEWRAQLHRVGDAYPDSPWPRLVARWDVLESKLGTPEFQPFLDLLLARP